MTASARLRPAWVDIYALRHAPAMRADGSRVSGEVYGRRDYAADCSDRALFAALGARLPADLPVVVSALRRTADTARALGREPVALLAAFNEQAFGDWEGRALADIPAQHEVWQRFHSFRPPGAGAEAWTDVRARVRAGLPALLAHCNAEGQVALISHQGALQALVAEALDMPDAAAAALQFQQCSLSRLRYWPEAGRWQVRQLAWLP